MDFIQNEKMRATNTPTDHAIIAIHAESSRKSPGTFSSFLVLTA